jgi:hypothetical protein
MFPVLSFGAGTFGGKGEFFRLGAAPMRSKHVVWSISVLRPESICSIQPTSTPPVLPKRCSAVAIKGRPRDGLILSTKATFRSGSGLNDVGSSRYHLIQAVEKRSGTTRNGLHRPVPVAWVRRANADGGSALNAGHSRTSGKDPLRRRLQLLRLAPDEVPGDGRSLWLSALCRQSDVLLPGWPRL